ncbi:helix-turn-helix transcriptional regulator [Pseudooceanicola onchidii]|uniref:helix-turn-helix transcriptional regulator n=1 Tax=Pseudooceanicola onchidii TaxID=2562279 RepID=UPI0010AA6ED2|nr:helix-turn-helix transcriptional regulator [Pseudooceanicola onchidii]
MARSSLAGSRIRERRVMLGLRQAELARRAGISASYLNLIEHNRRRIGGKLLLDIAQVLGVEAALLSEGAEAALTGTLREAAADGALAAAEVEAVDEFAGRFPGWAQLLSTQHGRIGQLEQSVEALTDRLAHDPHLAASLHEVLSTVTAIHASSSILVDTKELEPEWRDRFHRNIHEDSARLAEGAQRLVDELDAGQARDATVNSPQEEVDAFLDAAGHAFPDLERGAAPDAVIAAANLTSVSAQGLARDRLGRMAADVAALPMARLVEALRGLRSEDRADPVRLAAALGLGVALVMRRLVSLPREVTDDLLPAAPGLVIADASGTFLYRRDLPGFPLPRFGAACPLWPLFTALQRPMYPVRARVQMAGRSDGVFDAYAIAEADGAAPGWDEPILRTHMLLWPAEGAGEGANTPVRGVGVTCRICPREDCAARREPSIMARGA